MTKEDKQTIDRAVKENWRIFDRTRLKHLLKKNLEQYRDKVELEDRLAEEVELHLHAEEYRKELEEENNKLLDVINNQDVKIIDLEKQIEELKVEIEKLKYKEENYLQKIEHKEEVVKTLQNRIEKMKCCSNCAFEYPKTNGNSEVCRRCRIYPKPFTEWKLDNGR